MIITSRLTQPLYKNLYRAERSAVVSCEECDGYGYLPLEHKECEECLGSGETIFVRGEN